MKNIKITILTMVMCGVISLPLVYANEPTFAGKHEWKARGESKIFAQLNLSDEQKKQLDANKQKKRTQMKVTFEQMKTQREALHQEIMKPELDMNKINVIQAQIKTQMAQMADDRLNSILEVRKILTPEQFSKFYALMKEKHRKWEGKHSKGHDKDEEVE